LFESRREANRAGIGDNVLTRSIGIDPHVEVDVGDRELVPGDLFLLCSDGLCGRVEDLTIEEAFRSNDDLENIASQLQEAALSEGGRDNISLIVARVSD
jgi:protein phosphatase